MNYFSTLRLARLFERSAWKRFIQQLNFLDCVVYISLIAGLIFGILTQYYALVGIFIVLMFLMIGFDLFLLLTSDIFFQLSSDKGSCKVWIYNAPYQSTIFIKSSNCSKKYIVADYQIIGNNSEKGLLFNLDYNYVPGNWFIINQDTNTPLHLGYKIWDDLFVSGDIDSKLLKLVAEFKDGLDANGIVYQLNSNTAEVQKFYEGIININFASHTIHAEGKIIG